MTEATTSGAERKAAIRTIAFANRRDQDDKDNLSRVIMRTFMELPEYANAQTVMFYVDVRAEVRTRYDLPTAIQQGKKVVVPWCNDDGELELFHLESMDELEIGMYKILEPAAHLRDIASKKVEVTELDLIMVPGVGFDSRGGRTGMGKGYYDKCLEHARGDAAIIAVCFECQMFTEIPVQSHDIYMDKVITETTTYAGIGRSEGTDD
ncbi:MAG: 5-formyltetrahydrofolate cyclo-ligase [Planctomycetaceae bacterium]|nr:5-formyltetrahydrofolate cyclo-ligase [Planctomycetaceae bacterium]